MQPAIITKGLPGELWAAETKRTHAD